MQLSGELQLTAANELSFQPESRNTAAPDNPTRQNVLPQNITVLASGPDNHNLPTKGTIRKKYQLDFSQSPCYYPPAFS